MATDLDRLTNAELHELMRDTHVMATYRAARRLLDRRAQERAARRRAAVPRQREGQG